MEEHPTVKRFYEKQRSQSLPVAPLKLSSEEVRKMCLDLGADDAGFVEIGRQELDDQRGDIMRMFSWTKTLISLVGRINRENLRSPARSIASLELHQAEGRLTEVVNRLTRKLEGMGVRAVTPAAGFPMEAGQWPGKMHIVSHKPVAVAAGLGKMGLHRNVIHPLFGSFVLLGTVLIDAEMTEYNRPLDYNPCVDCKLCSAVCPTGAIAHDGFYNPVNCLTHTYRELIGGFSNWVENIADSKNSRDYRSKVSDAETISMWQSLATGPCYKSVYCMAVCPAGEDVIPQFLTNKRKYVEEVVKPLQEKEETVYVLPGSDAESYVPGTFPRKQIKRVGNGIRPSSVKSFVLSMQIAFQRNKSEGLNAVYHFTFTGEESIKATVIIKDKAITVRNGHEGRADILIQADSKAWLRSLNGDSTVFREIILRRIRVKGPIDLLKSFGKCFA
jgi:ferredoxin/putative sterol carrier protein